MLKILIVGEQGSGKTALANRVIKNQFTTDYQRTIGVDSAKLSNDLILFDASGEALFQKFVPPYVKSVDVILLTCDVLQPISAGNLKQKIDDLRVLNPRAKIILTGTKADELGLLETRDRQNQLRKIAEGNSLHGSMVISAKNDSSEQLLQRILRIIAAMKIQTYKMTRGLSFDYRGKIPAAEQAIQVLLGKAPATSLSQCKKALSQGELGKAVQDARDYLKHVPSLSHLLDFGLVGN